jgi:hypothetical protein
VNDPVNDTPPLNAKLPATVPLSVGLLNVLFVNVDVELIVGIATPTAVTAPALLTLNWLTPPTCRSISAEPAADAVSVTFMPTAVNVVPDEFHVSARL